MIPFPGEVQAINKLNENMKSIKLELKILFLKG